MEEVEEKVNKEEEEEEKKENMRRKNCFKIVTKNTPRNSI